MSERTNADLGEVRRGNRTIVNGTTLSGAGMVAILMVFFCVLQMRIWARELYGAVGPTVITFLSDYYDAQNRPHILDYEDMVEVAGQLEHVSEVFVSYGLNPRYGVQGASVTRLRDAGEVKQIGRRVTVKGVDPLYAKFRGYRMQAGRFIQQADERSYVAVISEEFAEEVGVRIGDRVHLQDKEFAIIGIVARRKLLGVSGEILEDVFLPVEPYRQIAAVEIERRISLPRVHLYLAFTGESRDAVLRQMETLLEARIGPDYDYLIGQATTAWGYTAYLVPAWGTGFLLIFALCFWGHARSLPAFFSPYPPDEQRARSMRLLFAASGVGGVLAGWSLSVLLVELHAPPILPALLSLAIVLPMQFLMAHRTLRRMRP